MNISKRVGKIRQEAGELAIHSAHLVPLPHVNAPANRILDLLTLTDSEGKEHRLEDVLNNVVALLAKLQPNENVGYVVGTASSFHQGHHDGPEKFSVCDQPSCQEDWALIQKAKSMLALLRGGE